LLIRLSLIQMKNFIESGKELPVPVRIADLSPDRQVHRDDRTTQQYNRLYNVVYKRLILDNCSSDPCGRMKPNDILKEITLLNTMCK